MLVPSQLMKSRKRLAQDIFDTFATHSGLVHDVTEIVLSKWQHLLSCAHDF